MSAGAARNEAAVAAVLRAVVVLPRATCVDVVVVCGESTRFGIFVAGWAFFFVDFNSDVIAADDPLFGAISILIVSGQTNGTNVEYVLHKQEIGLYVRFPYLFGKR